MFCACVGRSLQQVLLNAHVCCNGDVHYMLVNLGSEIFTTLVQYYIVTEVCGDVHHKGSDHHYLVFIRTEMGTTKSLPDILLYTDKLHGALHRPEQRSLLNRFTLKGTWKAWENCLALRVNNFKVGVCPPTPFIDYRISSSSLNEYSWPDPSRKREGLATQDYSHLTI